MNIQVLLFAAAKEAARSDSIELTLSSERPHTRVEDVMDSIALQVPELRSLLPSCRMAVNGCYVDNNAPVTAEDEIALIPPVSGG